jgi:hypothetical protein
MAQSRLFLRRLRHMAAWLCGTAEATGAAVAVEMKLVGIHNRLQNRFLRS